MLGHITYLSREAMMQKFDAQRLRPRDVHTQFETKFAVGSYLAYQGDRFGERFDANSYLTLTMAIDLFDLGDTPEKLIETLGRSSCRWLLLSFTSDWLFPPFQSQEIVDGLIAGGAAGQLLQRRDRLRARRLSAAEPVGRVRGDDPGVFGESWRRRGAGGRGDGGRRRNCRMQNAEA